MLRGRGRDTYDHPLGGIVGAPRQSQTRRVKISGALNAKRFVYARWIMADKRDALDDLQVTLAAIDRDDPYGLLEHGDMNAHVDVARDGISAGVITSLRDLSVIDRQLKGVRAKRDAVRMKADTYSALATAISNVLGAANAAAVFTFIGRAIPLAAMIAVFAVSVVVYVIGYQLLVPKHKDWMRFVNECDDLIDEARELRKELAKEEKERQRKAADGRTGNRITQSVQPKAFTADSPHANLLARPQQPNVGSSEIAEVDVRRQPSDESNRGGS